MVETSDISAGGRLLHSLAICEVISASVYQMSIRAVAYHSHDTPQFLVTDYEDLMNSSRKRSHENPGNPQCIFCVRVQELLDLGFIFVPSQNTNAITTQPSLQR